MSALPGLSGRGLATTISRRRLLLAGGTALLAGSAWGFPAWLRARSPDVFLSASDDLDERHFVSAVDRDGAKRFSLEVPVRCHGVAWDPVAPHRAVVFARRPGTSMFDVDVREGRITRTVRTTANRHLFGHGVFSRDGRVLFTVENDIDRGTGIVAVRDRVNLRVLEEISTGGIGPHELRLQGDGETLVVANGGLLTDPEHGRTNLNPQSMDPSLVYLDSRTGRLLETVRPDDHHLSIRHLSLGARDVVGVAMQHEGPDERLRPLVAFHERGGALRPTATPDEILVRMKHYTASICIDPRRGVAGVTCPRGNLVAFYDVASGELAKVAEIRDAGGIALSADGASFLLTTGLGEVHVIDTATLEPVAAPVRIAATRWDNHLALVG